MTAGARIASTGAWRQAAAGSLDEREASDLMRDPVCG